MTLESVIKEMEKKAKVKAAFKLHYDNNKEKCNAHSKNYYSNNRNKLMDRMTYSRNNNLENGIIDGLKARFMKEELIFTNIDLEYINNIQDINITKIKG